MVKQEYQYYQEEKAESISQHIFFIFIYILLIFYATIFISNIYFSQFYRYITINGISMQPTLNPDPEIVNGVAVQDGVYVRLTKDVNYGDIIIIDKSHIDGRSIVKRVLAFRGDLISIAKVNVDGKLSYRFLRYIKGQDTIDPIVHEDYIKGYDIWDNKEYEQVNGVLYEKSFYETFIKNKMTFTRTVDGKEIEFSMVGQGQIFYMGDNRTGSHDARKTGTESKDKIIGRVVSIARNATSAKNSPFWWFIKLKEYFVIVWNEIIRYFAWNV